MSCYSGPRELDHRVSYSRSGLGKGELATWKNGSNTRRKVQGPGRPCGGQRRSDHQRTGRAVRRDAEPTLIHGWKKHRLAAGRDGVSPAELKPPARPRITKRNCMSAVIGRLKMELEWLKKAAAFASRARHPDRGGLTPALSVRASGECDPLGLSRIQLVLPSGYETEENLRLMRLIDGQYTAFRPLYGSRRIRAWLVSQGETVNRKRVRRLLRLMGLVEAIYPQAEAVGESQPQGIPVLAAGRGR